jgi:ankyrin repeat protein
MSLTLPAHPNLEWLRKTAKQLLRELRETAPDTKVAEAQLQLARRYGFASWRKLVAFVDAVDAAGDELRAAVRANDIAKVTEILDDDPDLIRASEDLHERERPSDEPRMSLLHLAVAEGHAAMAALLVGRGAPLDARNHGGRTALHDCFELGRDDIGRMLIANGATLDACAAAAFGEHERLEAILRDDPAQANDRTTGLAPLGWSGYAQQATSADILIAHGAVIDADAWAPACHVAAMPVLRVLLERGGDPNTPDDRGRTPLHLLFASTLVRDPTEAVRLLLEHGADPQRPDRDGKTPLDVALAETGAETSTYFPKRPLGPKQLESAIASMRAKIV